MVLRQENVAGPIRDENVPPLGSISETLWQRNIISQAFACFIAYKRQTVVGCLVNLSVEYRVGMLSESLLDTAYCNDPMQT